MSKPKSNYARKNECDKLAHLDEPGGRVWGFEARGDSRAHVAAAREVTGVDKHEGGSAHTGAGIRSANWWRIHDLETAPRKLAGARLEGPLQDWPA